MRPENPEQPETDAIEPPVHYRIEVYGSVGPPDEKPVAVALCPYPGRRAGSLTDQAEKVSCNNCRRHLRDIGVAWQ